MDVVDAIKGRASTRAFLPQDVDRVVLEQILDAARWAPSGVNTQPWQVEVVSRGVLQQIGDRIIAEREAGREPNPDYQYYASELSEPFRVRRKACGLALYTALDIARDDHQARKTQWYRNYHGFGAPVELFVFIDRALETGSWMDMGMFVQNVMLAARGYGLESCPQAAMAEYPDIVRDILAVPDDCALVCGIALGYADPEHPVNRYRTARETVEQFSGWHGFDADD
ncbi:MAG: nitroreductase [Planctomycetaceae bacterium]